MEILIFYLIGILFCFSLFSILIVSEEEIKIFGCENYNNELNDFTKKGILLITLFILLGWFTSILLIIGSYKSFFNILKTFKNILKT